MLGGGWLIGHNESGGAVGKLTLFPRKISLLRWQIFRHYVGFREVNLQA